MVKQFITKDSGKRIDFKSGMRRDTQDNKPAFDLLMPEGQPFNETILYRWAMLMERGRLKYGRRNWEKANSKEELDRFKASAFRHFMQWLAGEDDEDHAVAVMFNITCSEFTRNKLNI